ncbi:hypothetical protein N9164_00430 [Draconibacterium sp.]|nr:hypothetical protein [Draconibacterium sp.]
MKSFSKISILILVVCFCFFKGVRNDKGTENGKYPLVDSYSIVIDIEKGFLLNSCEDYPSGSIDSPFFCLSVFNPETTSQVCKIPVIFNLRSPKLNFLTIDIPPPSYNHYS